MKLTQTAFGLMLGVSVALVINFCVEEYKYRAKAALEASTAKIAADLKEKADAETPTVKEEEVPGPGIGKTEDPVIIPIPAPKGYPPGTTAYLMKVSGHVFLCTQVPLE